MIIWGKMRKKGFGLEKAQVPTVFNLGSNSHKYVETILSYLASTLPNMYIQTYAKKSSHFHPFSQKLHIF